LAVRTSSSSALRQRNDRARFSVVLGLLSLAAIPVAWYSTRFDQVNRAQAVGGEAAAGTLLGLWALLTARQARVRVERTLARTGEGAARWGRRLGLLGLCLGLTAALALGFFGLLLLYE
jgi:hypothetical protein